MANKKPYGDHKRNYNKTKKASTYKRKKEDDLTKTKRLENTIRIRIDEGRLNDSDSLDTSFLGGRMREKAQTNKKVRDKILKEKKSSSINPTFFKNLFFMLGMLCIIAVVLMIVVNYEKLLSTNHKKIDPIEINDNTLEENVIDDNYLFIGNFYLEDMSFDDLEFYKPYVKVTDSKLTSSMILENIKEDVYIYNPSHVFLQIGLEELINEDEIDDIIDKYYTIIESIQNKRSYAKIFVMSLFPINSNYDEYDSLSNELIIQYNEKLKELADLLNVKYIDLFHELSNDNELDEKYSNDGIHLNTDGYHKIWKKIRKFIS